MSNAAFRANFAKLLKKVGDKADTVVRKCAFDIGNSLIMKSPVDSGMFRNNWMPSLGSINTSTNSNADKSGASSSTRLSTTLAGYKTGQKIFISNSLPYAKRLEYGWSNQAPTGMVRVTALEFNQWLKKAVAEVKST